MLLGTIAGTVVATRRADGIDGARYLLVEKCDQFGRGKGEFHVALDLVGAGPGEMIFFSLRPGSSFKNHLEYFDKAGSGYHRHKTGSIKITGFSSARHNKAPRNAGR